MRPMRVLRTIYLLFFIFEWMAKDKCAAWLLNQIKLWRTRTALFYNFFSVVCCYITNHSKAYLNNTILLLIILWIRNLGRAKWSSSSLYLESTGVFQLELEKDSTWNSFIGLGPWCWPLAGASQFSSTWSFSSKVACSLYSGWIVKKQKEILSGL